ncbi:hypothetical protein AM493_10890 [Flavobacterium akiainvivens]|uniref:Secretion system C-terminal sorting domain-containing protein n=2 Tax=Flavobacterium akiainvivens TaxID=1202724 RepID=A0A0M8MDE1_9FLAO|nr:hypothetical protein AM493_10890 [Flavobacterium akiainvivens]
MATCFAQQQAVITGDEMLCPNGTGTAMVQGIVPYDSYQWQVKAYGESTFANIAGATSSTFTYDQYTYSVTHIRCQVSQNGETFYSNELFINSLTFLPPFFSTETTGSAAFDPETGNYVICPGDTVVNSVMNGGNVQWFKDNTPIAGANTATYTITEPGTYHATTAPSECPGSASNTLPVVVVYNPTCAPLDLDPVIEGDTMLCPGADGTAEVTNETEYDTYQWQVKAYGEDEFADIEGATEETFTYGQYEYSVTHIRVKVTLDSETYYSNELFIDGHAWTGLTVAHSADGQIPDIDSNGNMLICEGDTITNSVASPYTIVQWYKDGEPIEGATSTTYLITAPGEYYVVAAPAICPTSTSTSIPFNVINNPDCAPNQDGPVIGGDTMLCPDGEGTAGTINNMVYDSYQWQVRDYNPGDEEEFTDIEGATEAGFTYGQYEYAAKEIRLVVTLDGETYYSNILLIDSHVFAGLMVTHTTSGQVSTDPLTGAFLLCGDAASVSNTVALPYTIVQWYKDGEPIEGATETTYVIVEPGEYYVVGSPEVCPDFEMTLPSFTVGLDPECTTGIDNPAENAFTVYPNPANTTLNLSAPNGAVLESYTIIDVTGKTLLSGNLTGATPSINIQALAQGSYIIRVSSQGAQTSKMFIKQ